MCDERAGILHCRARKGKLSSHQQFRKLIISSFTMSTSGTVQDDSIKKIDDKSIELGGSLMRSLDDRK